MGMEFILDGIVTIFMAVLIVYCIVLNNRLKKFRSAQSEMAKIVTELNEATAHAQQSISALRQSVGDEEARLTGLLEKSRKMADELSVITDVGANLADRIEKGLLPGKETPQGVEGAETDESEGHDEELLENLRNIR